MILCLIVFSTCSSSSFRLAYILGTAGSDLMYHHVLYLLIEQLQAGTHIGTVDSDLMYHHVLYLLIEQLQAGTHIGNSW